MKNFILSALLTSFPLVASEDKPWIEQANKNVSEDAANWLREAMSEELSKKQKVVTSSNDLEKECQSCVVSKNVDPKLYIFVSFSMPESAWHSLSKEAALIDGAFVLQGLPSNSFSELSKKLYVMKKNGLSVDVQINPKLFEDYAVTAVPTFLVTEGKAFDKISGHVSLSFALDLIEKNGETSIATDLKCLLKERGRL